MRFFELLQRVRFKDMVPILKEFCISDRQPVGQLTYYKQVFDCLRLMKPEITNDTMRVGTSDGEGDFWTRSLGKTIVYNDGLPSDDAVVAAHFLWNCTFYGFRPVASYNPHSDEENPYWMKSFRILEKDMAFAAHLSMKKYRKMTIFEKEETEVFDKVYDPRRKMNRSKRMRLHRHEIMKEKYDRMAKVWGTVDEICSFDADIKREDLNYLYDTALIFNDRFESHTEDPSKRIDYLLDLIENWSKADYRSCDSLVIDVIHDKNYPFTEEEMDKLNAFVCSCEPLDRVICGTVATDDFGEGAEIILIGSIGKSKDKK